MIKADQFQNLPSKLILSFSSCDDGTMLDRARGYHDTEIVRARRTFCHENGVNYDNVVYQQIMYDDHATYSLLAEADDRATQKNTESLLADGIYTKCPGVGILLPVGDCIATVLYDDTTKSLAMLHLGRHSTLTDLLSKTIRHFVSEGSDMADIQVWMAPSVQRESYRLDYFSAQDDPHWQPFIDRHNTGFFIDMQGYNRSVCERAGILPGNITISPIDTATNDNYFSHSQGDTAGRIAVVAMMLPDAAVV